jgi:hypothetical protein
MATVHKKMKKKAQTEILGVAIIVIILVIAGAFMLRMSLSKKESQLESYVDPEVAQSFLNALMNAETERTVEVSQIIRDCYDGQNDLCRETGSCCEYAYITMRNALDATLGEWGRIYRLTVRKGDEPLPRIRDIPEGSECDDLAQKEQPGFYPIPSSPIITVKLEICK